MHTNCPAKSCQQTSAAELSLRILPSVAFSPRADTWKICDKVKKKYKFDLDNKKMWLFADEAADTSKNMLSML